METIKIATFNAENLFSRPVTMNYENNTLGQEVLDDFHKINSLLKEPSYTLVIKKQIEDLITKYKLDDHKAKHKELSLMEIRGKLWQRHNDGSITWIANGSSDFLGWVELVREQINDNAIKNTAIVLAEVSADIQLLIEVENRIVLQQFHDNVLVPELEKRNKEPFKHVLLMDGNDTRGIDIALVSRLPVKYMKTNVELKNSSNNPLFARDCAEYIIEMPDGKELLLLGNHFSSQGSDLTGKRRKEQAEKVSKFVEGAKDKGFSYIIVAGDLNEAPSRGNLSALINNPELKDVMEMNQYSDKTTFPGTYQTGSKSNKLDYLFLSKELQNRVDKVDVERRGFKCTKWAPFPSVVDSRSQASDHHCVWVDLHF